MVESLEIFLDAVGLNFSEMTRSTIFFLTIGAASFQLEDTAIIQAPF